MSKKITAIITAAGSGSRFIKNNKSKLPKQFMDLNGKPVILYSLLAFQKSSYIKEIIVSANKKYFDMLHGLAAMGKISKLSRLVEGGLTRFESVRNAFKEIDISGGFVLIHDAARPNINKKFVDTLVTEALRKGIVIPALKIPETVKRAEGRIVIETIDRENLWQVQTPQIFRYSVLAEAYKKSGRKNNFTDEAALVESAGYKVYITEGKKNNLKLTTSEDLELLKLIMK